MRYYLIHFLINMKSSKPVLIIALMTFFVASHGIAFAPPADPDIVVPRLQIPVSLDGAIVGNEWSDAMSQSATFDFYSDAEPPVYMGISRSGTIYLKHDCVNLWICIEIEDPTEDTGSWVAVFYDVSGDGIPGSAGDDEKGVLHPDDPYDNAMIPTPPGYDEDTNLGGVKNIQGASGWADETMVYEFMHPLNSGDSDGNDPALQPGGSILASFMIGDPDVERSRYASGGRYDLIITPCPVGGTIIQPNKTVILTPILAVIIISIVVVSRGFITYRNRLP